MMLSQYYRKDQNLRTQKLRYVMHCRCYLEPLQLFFKCWLHLGENLQFLTRETNFERICSQGKIPFFQNEGKDFDGVFSLESITSPEYLVLVICYLFDMTLIVLSGPVKLQTNQIKLMLGTLDKIFSRQHLKIFFLFFPESRFWHFIQIVLSGDNLHKMSKPAFWGKYHQIVVCWISPESDKG